MKVMKEGTLDAKQQLNEVAQTSEPTLLGMTPDHPTEKPQLLMPTEVSPSWNSLMVEPPTSRRSSLGVYVENLPSSLESIHSEFEPPTEAQSSPVWTPVSEVSADIEVLGVKKFNLEDSLEELLQNLESPGPLGLRLPCGGGDVGEPSSSVSVEEEEPQEEKEQEVEAGLRPSASLGLIHTLDREVPVYELKSISVEEVQEPQEEKEQEEEPDVRPSASLGFLGTEYSEMVCHSLLLGASWDCAAGPRPPKTPGGHGLLCHRNMSCIPILII
uniref:Uncharacterized protein isoform X2 n=1 Tax=Pogona vitticeps TaxID=103695 RepID=A0ABM5EVU6_9SAUR